MFWFPDSAPLKIGMHIFPTRGKILWALMAMHFNEKSPFSGRSCQTLCRPADRSPRPGLQLTSTKVPKAYKNVLFGRYYRIKWERLPDKT